MMASSSQISFSPTITHFTHSQHSFHHSQHRTLSDFSKSFNPNFQNAFHQAHLFPEARLPPQLHCHVKQLCFPDHFWTFFPESDLTTNNAWQSVSSQATNWRKMEMIWQGEDSLACLRFVFTWL
ncbi:hypothetical protein SNK05_008898 [Fusarium graminearum]